MLSILYRYYSIFTKEFKQTLNHYIVNHVFNQLFMHWSKQVRDLFHLLLHFKIAKSQTDNPEINPKHSLTSFDERWLHSEAINENILTLREIKLSGEGKEKKMEKKKVEKREYYLNMSERLVQKRRKRNAGSKPSAY
jgi:hypothetical protein